MTTVTVSLFIFSGCFKDEKKDSPAVTPAADVTIDQVKSLATPSGSGTAPTSDAGVTATMDNITTAEDSIDEAISDIIKGAKASIKKSIKGLNLNKAARAVLYPIDESDSWDESGTYTLLSSDGFITGTVDYSTSGSYSDYENVELCFIIDKTDASVYL